MKLKDEQNKSFFSGVMLAYLVLLLHLLLMVGLGLAVVLIKGIYDFRWVIFVGGLILLAVSGYYFFTRFRDHKQALADFISDPAMQDRTLEISFLGGMASLRVGHRDDHIRLIEAGEVTEIKQLAAPKSIQVRELTELNRMLEEGLITRDEFMRLKKDIIS